MKALKLAAAGVALVLTGLALFLFSNPRGSEAPTTRPAATPVANTLVRDSKDEAASSACTFEAGQRFSYAASASMSWHLPERLRQVVGAQASGNSSWSAELHIEVLSLTPQGAVVLARLTDDAQAEPIEGLDTAWLARIDRRCEVVGFARHKATLPPAARAQQAALHELWFSVPDADTSAIAFLNGTGQARGEMAREGDVLVRHVKSYPQVWSRDMAGLQVTSSALTVRRGARGWFESMTGLEGFTGSSIDSGRVQLSVVSIAPRDVLGGASRNLDDYVWENELGPVQSTSASYVPSDYQERVATMKDVKFETALERFTVLADANVNVAAQWPDMAAFLDAHPETIEDFSTLLVTDFDPRWKVGGFLALGQTQNPAARESLLGIWRERRLPTMDRVRSSLALATRGDVGVAYAQELTAEVTRSPDTAEEINVARQALLHLGVLSGTHPMNQQLAEVVRGTLSSELAKARTPHDASVVFAAIGNTGDVTFLPLLRSWSEHTDWEMRAVVAVGMRRMPVEQVEAFTVSWLQRETHPDVKREIFEVVHHQYTDAGKPVGPALVTESVRHLRQQPRILTRQSLFRLLEPHVATNDEVRAAMRDQLKVEYDDKSGLFAFVASVLTERDVQSVLASMPTLRDQFNGVSLTPPSPRPVADAEPTSPPAGIMPKPPTAAELEGAP